MTYGQIINSSISHLFVDANSTGKGIRVTPNVRDGVTKTVYHDNCIYNTIGGFDMQGTVGNETYRNSIRDIWMYNVVGSASRAFNIYGSYNLMEGCEPAACDGYGLFTSATSLHVRGFFGDGEIRIDGANGTYENVGAESIHGSAPEDCVFRIAGQGNTFINCNVTEVEAATADYGFSLMASGTTLIGCRQFGTAYPRYMLISNASGAGTIIDFRGSSTFWTQLNNADFIANWTCVGGVLQRDGVSAQNGTGAATTFNIPHGLPAPPNKKRVCKVSAITQDIDYITADATNIIVEFESAPDVGTGNVIMDWWASL